MSRCRWRIDEPAPYNTHFATDHRDGCVHVGHGYNKISGFRENSNRLTALNGLQVTFMELPNGMCAMVTKNCRIVSVTILSCITFSGAPVQSAQPERPINSVREIRASLRACWISPAVTKAPQLTVRLSLKQNGEILGQPLITYQTPGVSEDERAALHAAVAAMRFDIFLC